MNLYHYFLQGFLHHPAPVEVGSLYHLHGLIQHIPSGAGFLPSTVSPKISGKGNPNPKTAKNKVQYVHFGSLKLLVTIHCIVRFSMQIVDFTITWLCFLTGGVLSCFLENFQPTVF